MRRLSVFRIGRARARVALIVHSLFNGVFARSS
jgi:hypothetical protein